MIGNTNYGELSFRGSSSLSAVETEDPVLAAFEPHVVYDGTPSPIFKIGDGVRPWSELPNLVGGGGGGAVAGWCYANALTSAQYAISGGQSLVLDNWEGYDYVGTVGLVGGLDEYGWAYATEGWYQIKMDVNVGFTVGALPLPEILLVDLTTYEGMTLQHEIPLFEPRGFGAPSGTRTMYGGSATITTQVYWSPDASVTEAGEHQSAHQLDLRWKGDAAISRGNGGAANEVVTMEITRFA